MASQLRLMSWLFLTLSAPASAQDFRALFAEGNHRYQGGAYEEALERYVAILEAGYASGPLYYNIGNCHFKLGNLGQSILYYERARREMPHDADVLANLDLARSLAADAITPLPRFWLSRLVRWWLALFPRRVLIGIVLASYLSGAAGLVAVILARHRIGRLAVGVQRVVLVCAVLVVVFGAQLMAVELRIGEPVEGVVLEDELPVQSAPSEDRDLQLFTIHEGTKVRVDQETSTWAEIVLPDGKVGWVKREGIGVI